MPISTPTCAPLSKLLRTRSRHRPGCWPPRCWMGAGLAFQAVALLGLSEGEFPRLEREDVLFSESDRDALRAHGLPLETRLRGDEGSLFYQAVTRARQKLLLTRPYLAEDGQPWEASPFWAEMRRLNGSRPVVRVRPEDGLADLADAASQVEWREAAREFDIHMKNGVEALMARLAPKAEGECTRARRFRPE